MPHVANSGGASLFLGSSPGDQIITLHFEQAMNSVSYAGLFWRLIDTTTK